MASTVGAARMLKRLRRLPLVGTLLHRLARRINNGAVVRVRWGAARGLLWRRYPGYNATSWLGWHEPALQRALVAELRPGEVCYDVGAHVGFFSLIAARQVGPTGAVYAFEPWPANAAIIRELAALNHLEHCQVVEAAVCDRNGRLAFAGGERPNRARLAEVDQRVRADAEVATVALDEFAATHRPPDVVKLDAERAELLVLEGMRGLLTGPRRPRFLAELHTPELAESCRALWAECGYRLETLDGQPADQGPLAKGHYRALPLSR